MTPISNGLPEPQLPALSGAFSRNGWLAGQCLLNFDIGQRLGLKVCYPAVTSLWPCCLHLISCNSLVSAISYLWAWKSLCSGSLLEDTCPSRGALGPAGLALLSGGLVSLAHFYFVLYKGFCVASHVTIAPCCRPWEYMLVFVELKFILGCCCQERKGLRCGGSGVSGGGCQRRHAR